MSRLFLVITTVVFMLFQTLMAEGNVSNNSFDKNSSLPYTFSSSVFYSKYINAIDANGSHPRSILNQIALSGSGDGVMSVYEADLDAVSFSQTATKNYNFNWDINSSYNNLHIVMTYELNATQLCHFEENFFILADQNSTLDMGSELYDTCAGRFTKRFTWFRSNTGLVPHTTAEYNSMFGIVDNNYTDGNYSTGGGYPDNNYTDGNYSTGGGYPDNNYTDGNYSTGGGYPDNNYTDGNYTNSGGSSTGTTGFPQSSFSFNLGGGVTFPNGFNYNTNHFHVSIINAINGEFVNQGWDFNGTNYRLGFDTFGSYIVTSELQYPNDMYSQYFYDGSKNKWVSATGVVWNGNVPNITPVNISDTNTSPKIDINFVSILSDQITIEGNITLKSSIVLGSVCDDGNGSIGKKYCDYTKYPNNIHLGHSSVFIEAIDKNSGMNAGYTNLAEDNISSSSDGLSKTYSYKLVVPSNGDYVVRVNRNIYNYALKYSTYKDGYYNFGNDHVVSSDDSYISGDLVSWSDVNGSWRPNFNETSWLHIPTNQKQTNGVNIDFVQIANNQYKLDGNVTLVNTFIPGEVCKNSSGIVKYGQECQDPANSWLGFNMVRLELTNKNTGKRVYGEIFREALDDTNKTFSYSISLPNSVADYIVRISKDEYRDGTQNFESFYYNGQTQKFVSDNNIQWIDVNGTFIPDINSTGYVSVTSSQNTLNINFEQIANSFYKLIGKVTLPTGFIAGEVCQNSNGETAYGKDCHNDVNSIWLGFNMVRFELIDKSTGMWITSSEINREADTNGTFSYEAKVSKAGDYIVRVSVEKYNSENGYSDYNGFYLKPINGGYDLISDRKVQYIEYSGGYWGPDSNKTGFITLSDSLKTVTANIDFVAISSNQYTLSGKIVAPAGFVVNKQDWQNFSNMRIEIFNANTGEWVGDAALAEKPNEGTTNEYNYSTKLEVDSADELIMRLVLEKCSNSICDRESFFINFGDDHSLDGDENFVSEYSVDWKHTSAGISLPDKDQSGYLTIGDVKALNLDLNYATLLASFESSRVALKGTITLSSAVTLGEVSGKTYYNNINVEAIDKTTGEFISHAFISLPDGVTAGSSSDKYSYDLAFQKSGDYIIKVFLSLNGQYEGYFINFGDDHSVDGANNKIISDSNIEWMETNITAPWGGKYWMPNATKTGWITLSSATTYDIDFASFANSLTTISGQVTVPSTFTIGDKYDSSGIWTGRNMVRIEAIATKTGKNVASTEVSRDAVSTGVYSYNLKLGDLASLNENDFIIKIFKEESSSNSWKGDEIYYNFGTNYSYDGASDSEEKFVNGKRVNWIEANQSNDNGYKNWMPNSSQTGWINITSSVTNVDFDISTFGANDKKISGIVTFKNGFDPKGTGNWADVSLINADDGRWIGNSPVESNGSYSINAGDSDGNYIVQVHYSHYDSSNYENSWWRSKVYDFGTDHIVGGGNDSILSDSDVKWVEKKVSGQDYSIWVPNVNYLTLTASATVNIDLTQEAPTYTISGTVTGIPSGATNRYVFLASPSTGKNIWREFSGNSYSVDELKNDFNFTMEIGYNLNNKFYNYFVKADGTTLVGSDVSWNELSSGVWGPSSSDVGYFKLSADTTKNVTISTATTSSVTINLTGVTANKKVYANLYIPGKPFWRGKDSTSDSSGSVSFVLDDIKSSSKYILSFYVDGESEYTYDANTTLKRNVQWIAYDSNGAKVCPKNGTDWSCDWDNSAGWTWKPDVNALTLSGTASSTLDISMPSVYKITGAISLGSDFANKKVHFNTWKYNGSDYSWNEVSLDSNGAGNVSMKVDGGSNYRIELWSEGLGGYVYTTSGWILNHNSWSENNSTFIWEPKSTTLHTISSDLDLGTINFGSDLVKVIVSFTNLDENSSGVQEDVWVSLESDTKGYYGKGNADWSTTPITRDKNITLRVPVASDYKLLVFPANHKGGFTKDSDSDGDFDQFGWDITGDTVDISSAKTLNVELKSTTDLRKAAGQVICKDTTADSTDNNDAGVDCSGWVDFYSTTATDGKGGEVNASGHFNVKGLSSASDYEAKYYAHSTSLNGLIIKNSNIDLTSSNESLLVKAVAGEFFSSITGTITKGGSDQNATAVLIETNGSTWYVIQTTNVDSSNSFAFGSIPKPSSGKAYIVAAGVRTINASGDSTIAYADPKEVSDPAGTVGAPNLGTAPSGTYSVTATAN